MFLCLLAAVLPAADVDPEPGPATKVLAKKEFSRLELIQTKGEKASRLLVLKNAVELFKSSVVYRDTDFGKAQTEEVALVMKKMLKVKAIDWDKQMLLVVTGGEQPRVGYRVEVTGLKVRSKGLTVTWKLHEPKGVGPPATGHPGVVLLVPRFNGKVVFEQQK